MAEKEYFGIVNGKEIFKYTIQSDSGLILSAMEYGATVTELFVPDKNGVFGDIAVGFSCAEDYAELSDNQGAAIGRYANRIKGGRFVIDGTEYQIPCNDGNNMLHGNNEFRTAMWTLKAQGENFLEFEYVSPDGTNGFPGELKTVIKYSLDGNKFIIDYDAVSTKKTVICLTNHLYFNLNADASKTINNHIMYLNADSFTVSDSELIPTGEIREVKGTVMDFTVPKAIGRDMDSDDENVSGPGGYDHNFCLNGCRGELSEAGWIKEPDSGRKMTVMTDMPGMQIYTGNWLREDVGKNGVRFCRHGAVCLETQFYPDTPNHPEFPQCTYDAGEHFISETVYKFSTED